MEYIVANLSTLKVLYNKSSKRHVINQSVTILRNYM